MCRWPLEDVRMKQQPSNLLTPVSAEQIISEEVSYFPNAAHAHSITMSRHPKRRLKDLLRVFGFTLLRSVAEYVHDDNLPAGWYDDGDSDESEETDSEHDEEGEADEDSDNDTNDRDDDDDDATFQMDTQGTRAVPIDGDLREHIHNQ
jgi:hypothetical protein